MTTFKDAKVKIELKDGIKKVVSCRDGIQEYSGLELGIEPYNKIFKLYRSPETIRALNEKLIGIPLTLEHVEVNQPIPEDKILGVISASKIISNINQDLQATLAIENSLILDEEKLKTKNYKEASLGYSSDTKEIENGDYDFEQLNIAPHHLAIVQAARCGSECQFKDEKENKMAIKEILEMLKKEVEGISEEEKQGVIKELKSYFSCDEHKDEDDYKDDEHTDEESDDTKEDMKDSQTEVNDSEESEKKFEDSAKFKDRLKAYADEKVKIINKAKNFLDSKYKFDGKDNLEIMRDVIKAEYKGESFKDSEIPVAFKTLKVVKKEIREQNFTDGVTDFNDIFSKEY